VGAELPSYHFGGDWPLAAADAVPKGSQAAYDCHRASRRNVCHCVGQSRHRFDSWETDVAKRTAEI